VWLANYLVRHGWRPGIVSRGYGVNTREPRAVGAHSDPAHCGDEPVLLARRSACPVWIGADRVAAAQRLLHAHPECSVVVSDDGLQHYRLARDFEIAVLDGERGLGNGLLLPAGPLREPARRLREVDAVVIQGRAGFAHTPSFAMTLEGRQFQNLLNPDHVVDALYFSRQRVRAIAGIGNPQRFFAHLRALGLSFEARTFPDHHAYTADDFSQDGADAIVMTEKDAVKCVGFASEKFWALPVDAIPDPDLGPLILRKLKS
jgi:tetraacyldisaccharide 4'-kinase